MCNRFKKTRKLFFHLFLLACLSGAGPEAHAEDPNNGIFQNSLNIQPVNEKTRTPLERVSPVVFAYHRLLAVLNAHGRPETDPFLLTATKMILSDPLSLPLLAHRSTDPANGFPPHSGDENVPSPDRCLREFVFKAAELLDLTPQFHCPMITAIPENTKPRSIETLIDRMAAQIIRAQSLVDAAFSGLSQEEKAKLLKIFPWAMDDFIKNGNLSDRDWHLIATSAEKIHIEDLLKGFCILSDLFSDGLLAMVPSLASEGAITALDSKEYPGLKGRFLMIRETPAGLMLVGDRGPNVYAHNASLIIDLGGDDLYLNNAGAPEHEIHKRRVSGIRHPIGIVIDFEGNDRYINPGFAALASGFFGVGVILDKGGDDFYSGGQLSLGGAFFGMGCLMDMAGNDTYVSTEGGQGSAYFGAAFLYDLKGDDVYRGGASVQGFGGPMGLGKLLDLRGHDRYRAGWKHGSSYGTKEIYQGLSQGVGWGFRRQAPGGIGILHDLTGKDTYEGGNFSQGTGYYFGLGVLRDDSGDDVYRGSRYCQGSAAHGAAGALLDLAGNDSYLGSIAANQGAAWDLSVACLVDDCGNDRYRAGDLSLGAGAQNGMGMFFDGDGRDRYESPKSSLGFSGNLSYGGGRGAGNMGIFLDVGGDKDDFTVKNRGNNRFAVQGNMGIFLDE